jgi:hypothetical protein
MVMPLWLGSSLRPEHAISELMAQTSDVIVHVLPDVISSYGALTIL